MTLGIYTGSLITYSNPKGFMIAFSGKTTFRFANGSNFNVLSESVAYIRNFTGVNASAAASTVVSDLNSIFMPVLEEIQSSGQAWTDFVFRASQTLSAPLGLLLAFLTSAGIVAGTFLIQRSDYRTDQIDARSSDLNDNEWKIFSLISGYPEPKTTLEIGLDSRTNEQDSSDNLEHTLENLEGKRVIRMTLFERKSEIFSGWEKCRS